MDNFKHIISDELIKYNCTDEWGVVSINHFYHTLYYCVDNGKLDVTATTESNYGFGGLWGSYNYYGESFEVSKFTSFDALYDSIKLDVSDILKEFFFGEKIRVTSYMTEENKKQVLKEEWAEKLHYEHGFCYTFDPKESVKTSYKALGSVAKHIKFNTELLFDVSSVLKIPWMQGSKIESTSISIVVRFEKRSLEKKEMVMKVTNIFKHEIVDTRA